MTDVKQPPRARSTLYFSAIFCLGLLLVLLYLIWRGPPTETALARQEYLKVGFIYYPLMALLAAVFAGIAAFNIKQILGAQKPTLSK